MLCKSSLNWTQGILNGMHCVYQGHDDVQVPLVGCSAVAWVSLLAGIEELECMTGIVGSSSALGMGMDLF